MYFVHSSVLLLGHKAARGHSQTLKMSGRRGLRLPEQQGWRGPHKSARASLRELEELSFKKRSEWGGVSDTPTPPPPASVHPSTLKSMVYSPVISTYGRCTAVLPSVKPWGQQTPGGDESRPARFSLAILPAISVLKCAIITLSDLCTSSDWRPFLLMWHSEVWGHKCSCHGDDTSPDAS